MRARALFACLFATGIGIAPGASAAPTSAYCLLIDNARNTTMTVEVDGYPGHYWVVIPNHTFALSADENGDMSQGLAGSTFSFQVYEGDERTGPRGALYDTVVANQTPSSYGSSSHTILTPVAPGQGADVKGAPSQCVESGFWLALIHD